MSENILRNVNRVASARWPDTQWPRVKPRFVLEDGALRLLPVPYGSEVELYEAAIDGRLWEELAPHEWFARSDEPPGASRIVDAVRARREQAVRRRWWVQWRDPESEPFRVTVALLEAFHREAREAGTRFAGVLLFPAPRDLERPALMPASLEPRLDARGIPHLDLFGVVADRVARGEDAFGENHLTPGANGEVARAVLEWLRRELDL